MFITESDWDKSFIWLIYLMTYQFFMDYIMPKCDSFRKDQFDLMMRHKKILPLQFRVNLGVTPKILMLWYWSLTTGCRLVSYVGCSQFISSSIPTIILWRCPWCNGYRRRKWTRRYEFQSWKRLIAFHIALIPLGKVWIILPPARGK